MIGTITRFAAWLLLAAAIGSATTAPDARVGAPVTRRGLRLVTADLHVHAFPGDGSLPPWDIRREARRRGIDVVAITNHNQMHAARLDRMLFPDPPPPLTLMAEELTAPDYHVIAIGIAEPVDWRLPLADALRAIHLQGGIAIAAHPVRKYREPIDDEVLTLLDGVEVAHPIRRFDRSAPAELDALYARAVRVKPNIAAIGSSDYHVGLPLGSWRTVLFARDVTQETVFDAIRAGRSVAMSDDGQAFGPTQWVAVATEPAAVTKLVNTRRHLVSVTAAWVALLFLVIAGPNRKVS